MRDLDIIVLYNKKDMFNQMKESADNVLDGIDYDIIGLDNTENKYSSVAGAYNYAIDNLCDAKVLVFCHQDVVFFNDSLKKLINACNENEGVLFGAAGVNQNGGPIISSIHQTTIGNRYKTLSKDEIKPIFALDECLVAASSNFFKQMKFDETTCDGFHLYAHDLCYQCHLKGIEVKVIDLDMAHLSGGKLDSTFFDCLSKLCKKYKKDYKVLRYTWGQAYTNPLLSFAQRAYRKLRYKM